MTVLQASLRLQSSERSCAELADLVALEPTHSMSKGAPVSSRNPNGPVHAVSTCVFETRVDTDELDVHVRALAPALARLRNVPDDIACDLVIAAEGRSLGSMLDLGPMSIQLLAQASCGLVLDLYNGDEE